MFGVVQSKPVKTKKNINHKNKKISFHFSFKLKRIIIWCCVLIFIFLLIGYYLYNNYYSNYNYIKEDKSQYLVYTMDTSINNQGMHNEIPYINIDSNDARLVNQTIQTYAQSFLKNKNNLIVYNSQLNGKILSVLLRMTDYREGYTFPDITFHTYNFDLDDQTLMDSEEILSLFHVSEAEVSKKIESQLKKYYQTEVDNGYFAAQECDYDCFLSWRDIEDYDYLDSVYYYIKNGSLIAYRPFNIYSVYGEENFFDEESYAFRITK